MCLLILRQQTKGRLSSSTSYVKYVSTHIEPYGWLKKDRLNRKMKIQMGKTTVAAFSSNQQLSSNSDVQVFTSGQLSKKGQAENISHELYGHTLLYIRDHTEKSYGHQVKPGGTSGYLETNKALISGIKASIQETIKNYGDGN